MSGLDGHRAAFLEALLARDSARARRSVEDALAAGLPVPDLYLDVVRPADANETAASWAAILKNKDRPAGLILSRQNLPIVPRGEDGFATVEGVAKGGYVLRDSDGTPDVVLIATGSEVSLIVAAQAALAEAGIRKGDVLALHSPNTVSYPVVFYAATRAGASVTTAHPLATAEEFARQLKDCAARWIVTVSPLLKTAKRAAARAGSACRSERSLCRHSAHRSSICSLQGDEVTDAKGSRHVAEPAR